MSLRVAVLVLVVASAAVPGSAQQSLGELGGPLRLDPEPTPTTGTVIDQQSLADAGPVSGPFDDPQRIQDAVESVRGYGRAVRELTDPTRQDWRLLSDPLWLARLHQAFTDLDVATEALRSLRPDAALRSPWRRAVDAAEELLLAVEPIDRAYIDGERANARPYEAVRAAVAALDAAAEETDLLRRRAAAEGPPTPLMDGEIGQLAQTVCGQRFAAGSLDERLCLERQRQAGAAIQQRFDFTVGLDPATFNSIRSACADEFPADLSGRNACETSRMAAAH